MSLRLTKTNPNACEACLLKKISAQFVDPAEFDLLDKNTIQLKFKKGDTILKQGGVSTHIVFLYSGMVKFNFENEFGKNRILAIVGAPKLLGGANMFYKDMNLFSICAVEDCEVCFIEVAAIKKVLIENGKYALMLFEQASEMYRNAVFNFISLAYKQVPGRIADSIIYFSEHIYRNKTFTLPLSRKEISEFAGCSQENVITTLSKLDKEGILSVEGKKIEIRDMEKLRELSRLG
jgi:CRP-like cAMP-binding protein